VDTEEKESWRELDTGGVLRVRGDKMKADGEEMVNCEDGMEWMLWMRLGTDCVRDKLPATE
jgi:hypothetical protein